MSRRRFLQQASALGAASKLGFAREGSAEPPPETSRIRLVGANAGTCVAPQLLAEELLRLEGFTNIEYVSLRDEDRDPAALVISGRTDFTMDGTTTLIPAIDAGRPVVLLSGVHGGCYELFGNNGVQTIRDLRNRKVAIGLVGAADHIYIASMMAYVGMDPRKDVNWVVTGTFTGPMEYFIDGRADAFMGFPPHPQQVRARKIGHVIVNTAEDRPWSRHLCCMIVGHREFVRRNPIATKRVVRAILKAADICARDPERAARYMVNKGYEADYGIALEVVKGVSYNSWRTFDPDDTLRFHALRLHEVGMIRSNPQKIIEQGTDWRFLNELKKELKA
jgi:NitT/TauT family transport system substrate-binding protein